jgi:putative addiction module CopG family antidote
MRTTQQFSITLPHDMAAVVEAKIASGAYASVSEVIRDGVRALMERDAALERWLRTEVVAAHEHYLAHPESAVTADELIRLLDEDTAADMQGK